MFFAPVIRRTAYVPSLRSVDRSLERFLQESLTRQAPAAQPSFAQDDTSFTLQIDLPGLAKDQLTLGIEGNVVRIESAADAARKYKAAYELPQEIDAATSEAKLENGVLTLKLGKKAPVSNVVQLAIQ